MSFIRPTLLELVDRVQQDFVSRLTLSAPILRRAMVYVFSRVIAGVAHGLHGHLAYLSQQIFPDQSDEAYLRRQAALAPGGPMSPNPADYASGPVTLTGTDGSVIPAGTLLQRADSTEFSTDADVTIAGGSATAQVTASEAGADGNCDAGTQLTLSSPIDGVTAVAAVATGGLTDGADQETIDAFRARFLAVLRSPPHGGNAADYVAWALEVPGVTRAWVYPQELGAGTVVVRFVRDNDTPIIPDSTEVAAVATHIAAVRPVNDAVTVLAPVAVALNVTVSVTPNTSAVQAAVQAEIADMLHRDAAPGTNILRSAIDTAVGVAAGVEDYHVSLPSGDFVLTAGQIATMGTVSFT